MLVARPRRGVTTITTQHDQSDDTACVTIVVAPACHLCARAHEALAELAASYPLVVATVDVRTAMGMFLVQKYRASMSPLVLLDGEFFSHGRLPRRKLAKRLQQRFGEPADTKAV